MDNNYYVEIIEYKSEEVVKCMGPMSEHKADRVDDGVNINLNHEEFYTLIKEKS